MRLKWIPYEGPKAEKLYATYKMYYQKYAQKGGMVQDMLKQSQYIYEYNNRRQAQQDAIEAGERTSRLNLAREIAADQKYWLNRKAIRGWYEISKEAGLQKKFNLQYFRNARSARDIDKDEIGDFLSEIYKKLKSAHPDWDTKTLSSQISHTYFGSP